MPSDAELRAAADRATPAAQWREKGDPDPHGNRYDCERAAHCMGHLTDDELANAVFMCDHRSSLQSMGYLMAAKDRIRWLSRALTAQAEEIAALRKAERVADENLAVLTEALRLANDRVEAAERREREARKAALQEAAKVADDHAKAWGLAHATPAKVIADAIRALTDHQGSGT